jgi:hypothetical protein
LHTFVPPLRLHLQTPVLHTNPMTDHQCCKSFAFTWLVLFQASEVGEHLAIAVSVSICIGHNPSIFLQSMSRVVSL